MERKWYYAAEGVRHGPVTVEELRVLIESGTLSGDDLVWQPEFGPEWRTVGQVRPALFPTAAAEAEAHPEPKRVPLDGVSGGRPSCLDAASQAYARVVALLFKPFDFSRWFSIGFCAWLAYIGTQSGNFGGFNDAHAKNGKDASGGVFDKLSDLASHPGLVAFLVVLVTLVLLLALWMCALRSRGDFMFLHRWYRPDAPILKSWSASRAAGHDLFVWRVRFFLVSALFFAALGAAAYLLILKPYLAAGKAWSAALVLPAVGCGTAAVLMLIAVQVVAHLAKAFVVPVMYWQGVPVAQAWKSVFDLCNQYPLAVAGYLLLVAAAEVAVALAVIAFIVCTCCVGAIPLALPYFNAVALLPALLFFRGLPVCFMSQWRPDLVPDRA
jgi:hypothetical protein